MAIWDVTDWISVYHSDERPGTLQMHSAFPGGSEWSGDDYTEWEFRNDSSVETKEYDKNTHYPMELTSPVLSFEDSRKWRDDIKTAFNSITPFGSIKTNRTCSMHIHISPGDGEDWTLEELKEICMAVTYFEGAFLALLPSHRRKNEYCQSHTAGRSWAKVAREEVLKLMNPEPNNPRTSERHYAWNFCNILQEGPSGTESTGKTIEWRQPPGVDTADDCLAWAELALNFIQAARKPGMHKTIKDYERNVGGLRKFIKRGLVEVVGSKEYMDSILTRVDKSECKTPTGPTVSTSSD